jgi:transaldolase
MNPLVELHKLGQSFWYDNMSRSLITSGELARLVKEDGLRGMTSNPTIFEKAIAGSADYDEEMNELVKHDLSSFDICEELMVSDIRNAADVLRPVYEESNGRDGFISLEVSPKLANDTEGTVEAARRLYGKLNRPNVMIKIPATPAGIPAIEAVLASGINVNITMLFARENYEQVVNAHLRGLELASADNKKLDRIASVASLFVSRVDTLIDKMLEEAGADPSLAGKAGIANARVLYRRYKEIYKGERFDSLSSRGAQPQRLLWASTSTKNPKYRDVLYIESLIGPETVDTMPPVSVNAFREHGVLAVTLEKDVDECERHLGRLKGAGIDFKAAMQKLQDDGVGLFAASFDTLLAAIAAKREALLAKA